MADTRPFELRSLLFLRTFNHGTTLSTLLGARDQGTLGDEETALLEARMYLSELLATAPPEVVARHAFEADARLEHVSVLLPRADLPRRLTIKVPLRFACVVLPAKGGAWIVVPAIDHTFFVQDDEDRVVVTQSEIRRVVLAKGIGPAAYLGLFPGDDERLEPITFSVRRKAGPTDGGRDALAAVEARKAALEVLGSCADAVTPGKLPPLGARDRERRELATLLGAKTRGSVLLVGQERTGKSALLLDWITTGGSPVFATSGARLIAGMSGFGQWQERVRRVMEAARTLDAILWLGDLSDLFSDRPGSSVDVPSAMRRFLEENQVRVVAELGPAALERLGPRNAAFFSCFAHVRVEPLSKADTLRALQERNAFWAAHEPDLPTLDAPALGAVVELSDRYVPYAHFPGKAVRLAADVRSAEGLRLGSRAPGTVLGEDAVFDTFSRRTGIPAFLLRDQESLLASEVEARLRQRVIGQEHAVRRVSELLSVVKAGLAPAGKPLATLLFVGPTGVGKTELARALAELLFGDEERLTRFDMSEYADAYAADRLFRGTERGDGLLTRVVRQQPFGVILLDEVEKAHPAVFDLLLQVFGEGRLTDGRGRTAYFHNSILVMTSNLGATDQREGVGFAHRAVDPEARYAKAVASTFRPELVGRLDRVVAFRSLTPDETMQVARLSVARLTRRGGLASHGIQVHVHEDVMQRLVRGGTSDTYGARGLRRHVERTLATPLATLVAEDEHGVDVHVVLEDAPPIPHERPGETAHGLRFTVVPRGAVFNGEGLRAVERLSALRREVRKQLHLSVVDEIREEVSILVTELGTKKRKPEPGAVVAERMATHARLAPLVAELDAAHADLCAVEELVLVNHFSTLYAEQKTEAERAADHAQLQALVADAEQLQARFEIGLAGALVALYPRRDAISLLVSELDAEGAFDLWLAPLLRQERARSWRFELNVHGEGKGGFGPTRSAKEFLALLGTPDRPFRHVLVRVAGENAGAWLGLETGLQRFVAEEGVASLFVRLVTRRAALTDAELEGLPTPLPDTFAALQKQKPARAFEGEHVTLRAGQKQIKLPISAGQYWDRLETVVTKHLLALEEDSSGAEVDAIYGDEPSKKARP